MLSLTGEKNSFTSLISTTGLHQNELDVYELSDATLIRTLSPDTTFLVSYKAILTEKYVQALAWKVPILRINSLYSKNGNLSEFKTCLMRKFEGAVFTTSGISNSIYSNYFVANGAYYEPNCSIYTDFLICDDENTEKYKFCHKYNIPIISTADVFSNKYELFKTVKRLDIKEVGVSGMFYDKVFYIDEKLPKQLYNKLKRLILENEGTRFPALSDSIDFILTTSSNYTKFKEYSSKVIFYQYIFLNVYV